GAPADGRHLGRTPEDPASGSAHDAEVSETTRAAVIDLIAHGRDHEAARTGAQHTREGGHNMTTTLSPNDRAELKTKQQPTWASGNCALIGTTLQIMGESLCEAVDIAAGSQVLDVAAGNGNATLAAARRGADVTCTDYVDTLLGLAQRRADAEGLPITTEV